MGTWQIGVVQNEGPGINRQYHQAGTFGPGIGGVPGDYNHNGTVDAADYVVWRDTLSQTGSGLAADGNGDQLIDADDYAVWATNFGQTAGSTLTSGAIPEPTSRIMLIAGMALAGRMLFRRRNSAGTASTSARDALAYGPRPS
jgi:hypothetical protein